MSTEKIIAENPHIDDLREEEPTMLCDWDRDDEDTSKAKKILRKIRLTKCDKEVLSYRMMGYTFLETARILAINASTVNNRLWRIRKKYGCLLV